MTFPKNRHPRTENPRKTENPRSAKMETCLFCGQEGSLLCRDCDRYTKARNRSFLHSFSKKWRMTYEEAKEKRKGNKAKKSGAWPTKQNRIPAPFKNEDTSDEDTADAEHEDLFAKWLAEEREAFARLVAELEVLLSG